MLVCLEGKKRLAGVELRWVPGVDAAHGEPIGDVVPPANQSLTALVPALLRRQIRIYVIPTLIDPENNLTDRRDGRSAQ